MAFLSGKEGKVTIGATVVNVTGWTLEETEELLDVAHSGSNCHRVYVPGLKDTTGTITANWNSTSKPTDNPPNFVPGQTLTTLQLELGDSTESIDIDSALVETLSASSDVTGLVTFEVSWKKSSTVDVTHP